MELCLLHANCQGEPLQRLLEAAPAFASRWSIRHVVNYTRETVRDEDLAACTLFLYQRLNARWGELASSALLARLTRLAPKARALCLPNLFFKGYWPLWTSQSSMHFGDEYLDYLVDQGLDAAEAVHIYMKPSLTRRYDLDGILAQSLALERQRQAEAMFDPTDFVCDHWRREALFETVNHPGRRLMLLVADTLLDRLGLAPLDAARADGLALSCDPDFLLPIHPLVGAHFGLAFAGEDHLWPLYGRNFSFRQYALAYADCRKQGLDLLAYLQAVRM